MARFNNNPAANVHSTSGAALFDIKSVFKASGGTVPRSSTGLVYNASGDEIVTGATGVGGFNTGAWFVVVMADGRSYLVQTGQVGSAGVSGGNAWRVLYSRSAGFTGGTPGTTRCPTATDQQILIGGGTDSSPTYAAFSNTSPVRLHVAVESAQINGVVPFAIVGTSSPGITKQGPTWFCEPMAPGSHSTDADPSVHMCVGASVADPSGSNVSGWVAYGTGSQAWVAMTPNFGPYNGAMGVDLATGNDSNGYPTWTALVAGSQRQKGVGGAMAFKGSARAYPSTANRSTDARLYLGACVYLYAMNTEPGVS
jgi:hypothetical protein